MKRKVLILFSYSAIYQLETLDAFYRHLLGRYYTEAYAEEGREKFEEVGFPDPLTEVTERIAEALEGQLSTEDEQWRVVIGCKHTEPFIEDVARRASQEADELFTLPLTPLYSKTGVKWYEQKVERIANEYAIPVRHIGPFGEDEAFIQLLQNRLRRTLHWLSKEKKEAHILFTSHSMPGIRKANVEFIRSYETLVQRIMRPFFQSCSITYRSGRPAPEKWLGPDVKEVCTQLLEERPRPIVAFELMSIIENVEAREEVGRDIQTITKRYDAPFVQVPYLNDSFEFVQCLLRYIKNAIHQKE